jgi:hypothetical protein
MLAILHGVSYVRAKKIPESRAPLRIARIFSQTKYLPQFKTGHQCFPERVAANADNDVQDPAVSRTDVVMKKEGLTRAITFVPRLHNRASTPRPRSQHI